MQLPTPPKSWEDVPRWAREVNNLLRSIYPRPSPDVLPSVGPGGTTYKTIADPGKKITRTTRPFQIAASAAYEARVFTSLLCGDTPAGFSPGDDPAFTLTVADGDKIWAGVTTDGGFTNGSVTSRFIDCGSSVPADDPEGFTFYIRLGSVSVDGDGNVTRANDVYGPIDFGCPLQYANPPTVSLIGTAG